MNKEFIQEVIERLLEIKKKVNIDICYGICGNMSPLTLGWLEDQFEAWDECHVHIDGTKETEFPVEGRSEYMLAQIQGTLWQNPKRLRLLDFLIEQAKTQFREMDKE